MAKLALLHRMAMAVPILVSLLLSFQHAGALSQPTTTAIPPASSNSTSFIQLSCKSTRYPSLCVECLSSYAGVIRENDQALARVSLSVTLSRARQAVAFVGGLSHGQGISHREFRAIRDCVANLGGSVDRLVQSIDEMDKMAKSAPGDDFDWHVSNVQTWISGALTSENTCLDGFAGRAMDGNIKTSVSAKVLDLTRVTSNALALMDRFLTRQKRSAAHGHYSP
ncbi:hypothetical protein SAY87_020556 [Trapa incisa]|uniref:Pectinesterase inhibitor domain-containing protein n=1 Tax=Trapa incisa TaxID=236973 RepID=A0AAN7PPQ9_9MYRT|nr:hypothetical protein SAY87_020556 [Trapa incisa]